MLCCFTVTAYRSVWVIGVLKFSQLIYSYVSKQPLKSSIILYVRYLQFLF